MPSGVSRAGEIICAAAQEGREDVHISEVVHEGVAIFQEQAREAAWLEWELAHLTEMSPRATDAHERGPR